MTPGNGEVAVLIDPTDRPCEPLHAATSAAKE
jgi:hypothetical protein